MIKIVGLDEYLQSESRKENKLPDVSEKVKEILENVKARGDKAVIEYEQKFDRVMLTDLEVSPEEKEEALGSISDDYLQILTRSANNIREFHSRQVRNGFMFSNKEGVILGQRIISLERVGLYIPGGTASYPSSVLMNVIPAKVAGVREIIMCTPNPNKTVLAAAKIAGVDKIFKIGGAQAIAAIAFGTKSVPRVNKIVGPGNIFVTLAKKEVYGHCDIDMLAGPSEILIVADENANPVYAAADLLSQAEHDPLACSILITTSENFAQKVAAQVE